MDLPLSNDELTSRVNKQLRLVADSLAELEEVTAVKIDTKTALHVADTPDRMRVTVAFRDTILHRILDLGVTAHQLLERDRVIPGALLSRATGETSAMLAELTRLAEEAAESRVFSDFFEKSRPLLQGSKGGQTEVEARNVLTLIERLDKERPNFLIAYERLSELSHPNAMGVLYFYWAPPDLKDGAPIGIPDRQFELLNKWWALAFLSEALAVALACRSRLDFSLPAIVRETDNLPLSFQKMSVLLLQDGLRRVSKSEEPATWASLHHSLGDALSLLGEREEENSNLELSVASYRSALEVYSEYEYLEEWAWTQNCLGAVLTVLGDRMLGDQRLREADRAFRLALRVNTKKRDPLRWAATQTNLGTALLWRGCRSEGRKHFLDSERAFRSALTVYTKDNSPRNWAACLNNLGNVLIELGHRASETSETERALEAFDQACEVWTRRRAPIDWGLAQIGRSVALLALAERVGNEDGSLKEADKAARVSLDIYSSEAFPHRRAIAQTILGNVLVQRARRERADTKALEAIELYRDALEYRTKALLIDWAHSTTGLGNALLITGDHLGARRLLASLLRSGVRKCSPDQWAMIQEFAGDLFALQSAGGHGGRKRSKAAYRRALQAYRRCELAHRENVVRQKLGQFTS